MTQDLWSKYRERVEAMLTSIGSPVDTLVGIIFVTPEAYATAKRARVALDEEDYVFAKELWSTRDDPYGFSPSETRTVACWAPLV